MHCWAPFSRLGPRGAVGWLKRCENHRRESLTNIFRPGAPRVSDSLVLLRYCDLLPAFLWEPGTCNKKRRQRLSGRPQNHRPVIRDQTSRHASNRHHRWEPALPPAPHRSWPPAGAGTGACHWASPPALGPGHPPFARSPGSAGSLGTEDRSQSRPRACPTRMARVCLSLTRAGWLSVHPSAEQGDAFLGWCAALLKGTRRPL